MNLEDALKKASCKIWHEMRTKPSNTNFYIHQTREEGLSTIALMDLYESQCENIKFIKMINARREKRDGFDFLIYIGDESSKRWVKYYVQAKKLDQTNLDGHYKALKIDQLKKLYKYYFKKRCLPVYALYNHLTEKDLDILEYYNSETSFDKQYLGITLASLNKVNQVHTKTFRSIHSRVFGPDVRLPLYKQITTENLKLDLIDSAVPFHEMAYFDIEEVEIINANYKNNQNKSSSGYLPFFFFFFFLPESKDDYPDELIPIIRNKTAKELLDDFLENSGEKDNESEINYSPEAICIIQQDRSKITCIEEW